MSILPAQPWQTPVTSSTKEVPPKAAFPGQLVSHGTQPLTSVIFPKGIQRFAFPPKFPRKEWLETARLRAAARYSQLPHGGGVGGAAWHPRPALAPFVLGEQWQSSKCSLFIPSFLPDLWIRTILIQWNKEQLTGQGIY